MAEQTSAEFVNDYFGGLVPGLGTTEEVRSSQQSSNSTEIARRRAKNESHGTKGTTQNVPGAKKKTRESLSKGAAITYKGSTNKTGYVPNPDDDSSMKAADYYRTGLYTNVTKKIAGEDVTVKEWQPMPEQIQATSDDYNGVLASIKLVDPKKVKTKDSGSQDRAQLIPEYSKFFLESVQESHQEKVQIVETFNDFYAFFYGEKPPIYNFSGHLLNLQNYNWMNEFIYYYQNFWRGTKSVELGARIFLTYNYQQIQGYVLNVSTNINALTDKAVPFNMQVLVTKRLIFNGQDSDGVIRDNLLPNKSPLIETQASTFLSALAKRTLSGERPASGLDIISDSNAERGINTVKNKAQSSPKDKFAGGNEKEEAWFDQSDEEFIAAGGTVDVVEPRGNRRANSFLGGLFS